MPIDLSRAEAGARELLLGLGADLDDESLRDTPGRMARAYVEMLTPVEFSLTTFPNENGYDELIVQRAIPFHSLCEHHLLPFIGVAHVGYLPGDRIVGLSKLARIVEHESRNMHVQERMTKAIADRLQEALQPRGVGVVVEAEHLCMTLRGVCKPGTRTSTSALHGIIRDDPRTRQEFLSLARLD